MSRTLRDELIAKGVIIPAEAQASQAKTPNAQKRKVEQQKEPPIQLPTPIFAFFPLPQPNQGIRTQLFWLAKAAKQLSRKEDAELKSGWEKVSEEVVSFLSAQVPFNALESYKIACSEMRVLLLAEDIYKNPELSQKLHELIKERKRESDRLSTEKLNSRKKDSKTIEKKPQKTKGERSASRAVERKEYVPPQKKPPPIILTGMDILRFPAEKNDNGIYLIMVNGRVLCGMPIKMGGRGACNRMIRAIINCCQHSVGLDRRPQLGEHCKYNLDEVCSFLEEIGGINIPKFREYMGDSSARDNSSISHHPTNQHLTSAYVLSSENNSHLERRREEWKGEFEGLTKFDWHGLK